MKSTASNYPGMIMTIMGISETLNIRKRETASEIASTLSLNAKLSMSAPQNRTRYIMNIYFRITYNYNAILLENTSSIIKPDVEICRRLLRSILKRKYGCLITKTTPKFQALFQITPVRLKMEFDSLILLEKLKSLEKSNSSSETAIKSRSENMQIDASG